MIRYRFIIAIVLGLMLSVSGCGQGVKQVAAEESITDYETESVVEEAEGSDGVKGDNTADTEEDTMTGSEGYKKALVFMVEKYGFTVEELLGLDVEALIADYRLDSEDYTKEEIAEIIEDQREYYLLNPADEIFSISIWKMNCITLTTVLLMSWNRKMQISLKQSLRKPEYPRGNTYMRRMMSRRQQALWAGNS